MAFFGLFQTKQQRDIDRRMRMRQCVHRIESFLVRIDKQANEYRGLARRAFELDDLQQFETLAIGFLRLRESKRRWECYLVKLRALELRKIEGEVTRGFLQNINATSRAILAEVQPAELESLHNNINAAVAHSERLEETLAAAMDGAATDVLGVSNLNSDFLRNSVGIESATADSSNRSLSQSFETAMQQIELQASGHQSGGRELDADLS